MIINLTQHAASSEQEAAGVVNVAERTVLSELLTFATLPTSAGLVDRAEALADLATGYTAAMIGGAPYLMAALEQALLTRGIEPVYAFSVRESIEQVQADGSTRKTAVFRHVGFVRPSGPFVIV